MLGEVFPGFYRWPAIEYNGWHDLRDWLEKAALGVFAPPPAVIFLAAEKRLKKKMVKKWGFFGLFLDQCFCFE
ncbi:MAG: hypothetical protein ABFS18_01800 [Thermodesulfobacteriota bacterium]